MTYVARGNWLWLVAYLLMLTHIVLLLWIVRETTLESLGTPQARAEWNAHRAALRAAGRGERPAAAEDPRRAEPPALVLLRDYFGVLFVAALVFGTALFAMLMFAIKGTLWRQK